MAPRVIAEINRKKWVLIASILFAVFIIWSFAFQNCAICNLGNPNYTNTIPSNDSPVDVSANEAFNLVLNSTPNVDLLILDVRTQSEFDAGHLEHAILLPYDEIGSRFAELLEYSNISILVYCRTGNRSGIASDELITHGFTSVYNMLGGISTWIAAEYPVVYSN